MLIYKVHMELVLSPWSKLNK